MGLELAQVERQRLSCLPWAGIPALYPDHVPEVHGKDLDIFLSRFRLAKSIIVEIYGCSKVNTCCH